MILYLRDLPEDGPLVLDGTLDPQDYDLGEEMAWGPIHYRFTATRLGKECLVQGTLDAQVSRPCDRCLEPLPVPIECEFTHSFEMHQLKSIDLTHPIHEDILLSLPIAFRCRLDAENRCPITGRIMEEGPNRFQEAFRKEAWQVLENLEQKD